MVKTVKIHRSPDCLTTFSRSFACLSSQNLGSPLLSCQNSEPRREGIQSPEVSTRREGIQSPEFSAQLRWGVNHTLRFLTGKARRLARDYRTSTHAPSTIRQCAERGVEGRVCTVRGVEVPTPYFCASVSEETSEKDERSIKEHLNVCVWLEAVRVTPESSPKPSVSR